MSANIIVHRDTPEIVIIGTQKWMLRNYDFGGTYPWGDYDLIKDYGSLFTWTQAMTINLPGWHLPSATEAGLMVSYLGGSPTAGGRMKEVGTTYWTSPNTGATNSSGFSARATGYNEDFFGQSANFWCTDDFATEAFYFGLHYLSNSVTATWRLKTNRISVRLIKDV